MDAATIVGFVAASLTTLCFIPQIIKIFRERQTKDISLLTYLVFLAGICCWLVYGIMLSAWPIIVSNIVTIVLLMVIIVMKIRLG